MTFSIEHPPFRSLSEVHAERMRGGAIDESSVFQIDALAIERRVLRSFTTPAPNDIHLDNPAAFFGTDEDK